MASDHERVPARRNFQPSNKWRRSLGCGLGLWLAQVASGKGLQITRVCAIQRQLPGQAVYPPPHGVRPASLQLTSRLAPSSRIRHSMHKSTLIDFPKHRTVGKLTSLARQCLLIGAPPISGMGWQAIEGPLSLASGRRKPGETDSRLLCNDGNTPSHASDGDLSG